VQVRRWHAFKGAAVDRRILLRIAFVLILLAAILLMAKLAVIAFDPQGAGRRMERVIDSATVDPAARNRAKSSAPADTAPVPR
jgi:hypothetical protein